MRGRLRDLTFGPNGEQHITVTVSGDFRGEFDKLKDSEVRVEIKKWREPRSKDANVLYRHRPHSRRRSAGQQNR